MSFQVKTSRKAASQVRSAARWWVQNRTKAPQAFTEELERAFDLICGFPTVGEPVPHSKVPGVRRILLGRVQYHLYYTVEPAIEIVEILALWHTSREGSPEV